MCYFFYAIYCVLYALHAIYLVSYVFNLCFSFSLDYLFVV